MTDLARHLGIFLREYLPRDRRASRHTIESYTVSLKLLVLFAANPHFSVRRERRVLSVGEIPTRQLSFQPVAIGTVVEVTKRLKLPV